jgi:glycosyltransferase involved in cell wall biosynthesis
MMNILHTITGTNIGGAEIMLFRLVAAMEPGRFASSVVSLMPPGPIGTRLTELSVPVHSLGMAQGLLPSLGSVRRLADLSRRLAPDLVQGWMHHGNLAGTAAWLRLKGRPRLVWSVHHSLTGLAEEKSLTRGLITLLARLSRLPHAIVYCSRVSARQHEAVGFAPERGIVIPNGIDTVLFQPDPDARARLAALVGAPEGRPLVGMVARAHPMKDHANLVRAAGLLRARGIDLQLVLLGSGVDRTNEALFAAAKEAGVQEDRLSALGQRDDVPRLVPGLDLLASPSAWGEAFPLAVGEAMASGVPCVVTDIGDCAWLVGGAGAVVPPRDPEALAAEIGRLLGASTEERRALGALARARIAENFALARVARRYAELYTELAGGGNAAVSPTGA